MRLPPFLRCCKAAFLSLLVFQWMPQTAKAEWQNYYYSLGWAKGTNIVWQFSFDPKYGKPFFHPVTVAGGPDLTNFKPEDHPWHYGMWFSWKYINGTNYWEEDKVTGQAEGATRWNMPTIKTSADGKAVIKLELKYTQKSGYVDLTESRELQISAPAADGSYMIDWDAQFTAGEKGAVLDRTPMPNEPNGKVNGGYAGLGIRMASAPLTMTVVTSDGPIDHFESDRARPSAAALGCNFADGSTPVGSIAIISDPGNAGESAPWYVINSDKMRFACAAILAPKVRTVPPNGQFRLHYRIAMSPKAWTEESLKKGYSQWTKGEQ